jgi:hypothetical protein
MTRSKLPSSAQCKNDLACAASLRFALQVFAVLVLVCASGVSAQGASCDPAGCEGTTQSHFLGEPYLTWTFTPPLGFHPEDDDGECHTDCSTKECVFLGKLKVTNNTGSDRVVVTDYGVSWNLPSGHSVTFTNVEVVSGCGVTPAKNYRTETTSGTWTSSYQFLCAACWAIIE